MKPKIRLLLLAILFLILLEIIAILWKPTAGKKTQPLLFDGEIAYQHVVNQVNFGPRTPGSEGHEKTIDYIAEGLNKAKWSVEIQEIEIERKTVKNIIARRGNAGKFVILGAHYDTRFMATEDLDPKNQSLPVPGANDGASGVAVLLEMARIIPEVLDKQVWLVFFDAEDQGKINGWDWILGSRAFVNSLKSTPDAVVIIDMIGDANLNIYQEYSSNEELTNEVWQVASQLGYQDQMIDEKKYSILDDHTPFLEAGIPAIDIIDFDYPYWHTIQDTPDKVSMRSLEIIGTTLIKWLVTE
jgi:glutaminyl-peptide cyclotransferase